MWKRAGNREPCPRFLWHVRSHAPQKFGGRLQSNIPGIIQAGMRAMVVTIDGVQHPASMTRGKVSSDAFADVILGQRFQSRIGTHLLSRTPIVTTFSTIPHAKEGPPWTDCVCFPRRFACLKRRLRVGYMLLNCECLLSRLPERSRVNMTAFPEKMVMPSGRYQPCIVFSLKSVTFVDTHASYG